MQGKTEMDSARGTRLLGEMQASDQLVPDLDAAPFLPLVEDERRVELRAAAVRDGQGTFRARLLDAYGRSCAITGEHTQPVLDAAHIQPYLGPRSNHVQNGLLLTNEFRAIRESPLLFVFGYVTVTPEYVVRVSRAIRESPLQNGKRYYPCDGKRLAAVPANESLRPSASVLAWHNERVFRRAG